ncbi:uncharacterized protein LOC119363503 [Triticum dicoccoides]|uniref:uncharacterized protein LOC119363503 n=1 Tax=Triticum dicoccoides TaxID=85692 RepID=UPI000E7BCC42|nr:uncharacterized protein LOC119363503 [Triticum dicoccoides]
MPRSPSPEPERSYPARRRGGGGGSHVLSSRCRSPSPPPRRSLRPRRAAAASSRPLVDDFFPFPSSPSSSPPRPQHRRAPSPEPSSSDSDGGGVAGSSASDRRRRKLKLVVKLSQLPPDQHHRRAPPPPPYSDSSEGEDRPAGGGEEQVKPPKKRRIESRDDRSRSREVAGRSDAASAPRTKRLPVPGMARTTPLPDRQALDMILDKLQKKDTYGVFAEPVDLEELPDYNDVIEHPMDFGTVKRKLARNAYRSFEQFEDDVFLICSNAMVYNAPDTVYFRQAHSIQELARKKFQELRDEGIPTENQVKSEQKVGPIPCNRGPIKKPVLRYSDDDLDFLTRKEQIKRPNAKISGADISFRDQVKKPASRNSENDLSSSFHKERVKKPIFRNSENNLSSSFHGEQVKKSISRNSEDDRSSSIRQVKVKKAISRNSEDDRSPSFQQGQVRKAISRSSENDRSSSLPQQQVKKPTSRSSKDGLSSQKTHVGKPVCRNGEDPDCSLEKEPSENPGSANGEDLGLSPEKLVEEPSCRYRDDMDHSRQTESAREPFCRDGQDDLGDSCNEEIAKPFCLNGQDALGSNVSPATIVSAGDGSDGLSVSQANGAEPPESTAADGCSDKDISSPVDEVRSEKTDDTSARDYSAKPSHKSFVVDETRRKTYHEHEDQPSSDSDLIFDVFCAEPKELINVGLHAEHSYARSLARFAGSLGAQGWRIASERIQQTLPAEVRFGRGWVGEYEPPLPPILVMQDQLRSQVSSDTNMQRNASVPRDNERLRPTESINSKDMSLSLLNRITSVNNVIGVTGSLESPELKPRLFGVSAEPQHRNTDALPLHDKHRASRNAVKTKRATNDQVRKGRHSSNACPPEVQPQRSECSKGASSVLDVPAVNKMAGHRPFFQPPEAVRAHQMKKSDSSQSAQSTKGPGVHDMLSPNNGVGHPKPFFQSQEPVAPQPKNEATWVYHGRPGDAKFGTSEKSRQTSNIGFITKNEPVNANGFAMNASAQNNISDHAKSMVPTAVPGQVNVSNRGFDAPRNIFSAFPTAVRENQGIPSAPVAQSWISFGASSENKPTIVSPNFNDGNSGWKMPFANVRTCDEMKISAVPQFFRQPVQVPRESPGQNKGLVIFPQLVQTDFSRSQGQSQWQGLVPHMQQKPNMDMLRPDLNIGFPSPGSPPARQSSGINLEAQQPDLALQL